MDLRHTGGARRGRAGRFAAAGAVAAVLCGALVAVGARAGTVCEVPAGAHVTAAAADPAGGWWLGTSDGNVTGCQPGLVAGAAPDGHGPVSALASTPDGKGWWAVHPDGSVAAGGDAPLYGSPARPASPVVAIAPTPSGLGYWLAGADGGVFCFGDAPFYGSAAGRTASPVTGLAADPLTGGYWLVTAAGAVLGFHAPDLGSAAGMRLAAPVVGIAATDTGRGYWLAGADGGVFTYGDAPFRGSASTAPGTVVTAVTTIPGGYLLAGSDGTAHLFTGPDPGRPDALTRRTRVELADFTDWLAANHVAGVIGEVGWPDATYSGAADSAAWNRLAADWTAHAGAAGVGVVAWAVGESQGTDAPLSPYEAPANGLPVSRADSQAAVLEAGRAAWGVNYTGGENGYSQVDPTSTNSNADAPALAYQLGYDYGSSATYGYLASRGARIVRLPTRWERLQPTLGAALDPQAVSQLKAAIGRIAAAGMVAVVDVHNFAGYYSFDPARGAGVRLALGTPQLPVSDFADLWRRLSAALKGTPGVAGYDLMNEPTDIPAAGTLSPADVWHRASQAALDAIRSTGDATPVWAEGYLWSAVQVWQQQNPSPWLRDPAGRVVYEAHHYFDLDHSSRYTESYAADDAAASSAGY